MEKQILIPLPSKDFDPTETGVPWKILNTAGVKIKFATPSGTMAQADQRMVYGHGLGPLSSLLAADKNGRDYYFEMIETTEFKNQIKWSDIDVSNFDSLLLAGGHAKGMREYLDSEMLQDYTSQFFQAKKPIGAICHGVVLAARSKSTDQKSILYNRRTTSLLASQEISAWLLTCAWLGNYYRTYSQTVESEVKASLATKNNFINGPTPIFRDNPQNLSRGFVVQDEHYLSARWPGDAHLFGVNFLEMIKTFR